MKETARQLENGKIEDGSVVEITETALYGNTYDKVITDIFQHEGFIHQLFKKHTTSFELILLAKGFNSKLGGGISYWSLSDPVVRQRDGLTEEEKTALVEKFKERVEELTFL